MTKYNGSVEKWVSFLSAWAERRNITVCPNKDIDPDLDTARLYDVGPASFAHFYEAMTILGWPELVRVEPESLEDCELGFSDDLIVFRQPEDVLLYGDVRPEDFEYHFSEDELEETPEVFSDPNYRVYSREQEYSYMTPWVGAYRKSLLVGECNVDIFMSVILLNPLVKFPDGEWEAVLINWTPYDIRFPSFADLIVWFYLRDPVSGVETDAFYRDHRDDVSGISKCLFDDD